MSHLPPQCSPVALHPRRIGETPFTAELMWSIPRVGAPAPAPDGSWIAVPVTRHEADDETGGSRKETRIHRVDADSGESLPLTAEGQVAKEPRVSPCGTWLAFVRPDDDDVDQLFVLPVRGGEARRLTDLPHGVTGPRWLPDGSGLVVAARLLRGFTTPEATREELARRKKAPAAPRVTEDRVYRFWDKWLVDGELHHLFHVELATGEARDLMPDSEVWFPFLSPEDSHDVSPDGAEVAYVGYSLEGDDPAELRSRVYTVPLTGGTPRRVTSDDAAAGESRPRYSPDGRRLVFGRKEDPHFYADRQRLWEVDRASGELRPRLTDWDLSPDAWEYATDATLVFTAADQGRTALFRLDDGSVEPVRLIRGGTVSSPVVTRQGTVFFGYHDLSLPPEVARCGLDAADARRLTSFTAESMEEVHLGEVRDARFEGADGESVQMFLVLPPDYRPGERYPLVQVIHGGPHGASADSFHFRWNAHLFAAPGYVAALVNFQGSIGFGQDFAQRIQGALGDRPYRDLIAATDELVECGLVDPDRMAAAGGSYGGYMAAWIATQTDRFRCVVNHAGVFDWVTQYGSDVTQSRGQAVGGVPWDGLDAMDRYDPARTMADATTPMLLLHGSLDYRVPVGQALECYGILKARGVPARLVVYEDENHWILARHNSIHWYREVHEWLARFLA